MKRQSIGIDIMLIVISIILGISLKRLVDMSVNTQALEKLVKTYNRDIQIHTKEFKENQFQHCIISLEKNSLWFSNNPC